MQTDGMSFFQHAEEKQLETMRKKYLETLMVAKQNPTEETLSLVCKLREKLQYIAMCPMVVPDTTQDSMVRQQFQLPPLC